MTPQEANRIIAEFMGSYFDHSNGITTYYSQGEQYAARLYSKSLDALVPVWEKLKGFYNGSIDLMLAPSDKPFANIDYFVDKHCYSCNSYGDTIQEAAAIATAKAIQELK